jgi:hypothetical protein
VVIYHVFGIISSSLLSELQGTIPEGDHNHDGVCICGWCRSGPYVSYLQSYLLGGIVLDFGLLNLSIARPIVYFKVTDSEPPSPSGLQDRQARVTPSSSQGVECVLSV